MVRGPRLHRPVRLVDVRGGAPHTTSRGEGMLVSHAFGGVFVALCLFVYSRRKGKNYVFHRGGGNKI